MKKILYILLVAILLITVGACNEEQGPAIETKTYLYNAFTHDEQASFTSIFNDSIPFIPNDEYHFEKTETSIHFYTVGNSEEEFTAYQKKVISVGYKYVSWDINDGHGYEKNDISLLLKFYNADDKDIIDVYMSFKDNADDSGNQGGNNDQGGSGNQGGTTPPTTSAIQAILNEAANLADQETLSGDRTATGTVKTIDDAYSTQYKNISFVLTDGVADIVVHRATGDCAEMLKVGDTVTVTGQIINWQGTIEFKQPKLSDYISGSGNQGGNNDQGGNTSQNTEKTIAEFIQLADTSTYYTLTGEVTDISNTTFGNLTLKDSSGEIFVYGVLPSKGSTDKENFTQLGISVGDTIKISGTYLFYNNFKHQVVNAYLIEIVSKGSGNSGNQGGNSGTTSYQYTDFTQAEKDAMNNYCGFVIPFIPNNYYESGEFDPSTDGAQGIYYYTEGNTQAEYEAYKTAILNSGFTFEQTWVDDEYGDTWYIYSKNDAYLSIAYYYDEDSYWVEVQFYVEVEDSGNQGGSTTPSNSSIQDILDEAAGLANKATLSGDRTVTGVVTEIEEAYTSQYKNISFYISDGVAEIYVHRATGDCAETLSVGDTVTVTGQIINWDGLIEFKQPKLSDYESGNGSGGNVEKGELVNNDGKGLPTDSDGVYDVDFTDAEYIKNVTEQGYYLDGCPTEGDVKVLVIPVEFSDATASSKGYDVNKINLAFNGTGNDTDYRSVSEYYFESSNGKLNLDFYVYNEWFKPSNTSSYYQKQTIDYYGSELEIGDQMVMDEALAYLSTIMDLSQFDSDNNGIIDAVVLITTLEIDSREDTNFYWAYRYWNLYTDEEGYYYEYDNVSANDYLWASYQFLFESSTGFDDEDAMNTYTFIHEFGHVLGVDDYYNYADGGEHPLDGADVMDSVSGDHNPFTKFNLGWITTSRLVVASDSITLSLKEFTGSGDTIIIANNWDSKLGAYQEYYVLMYYRHTGLNEDGLYFVNEGVVMYHVNASLEKNKEQNGYGEYETYYDVYNSNSDLNYYYGTEDNLIELCKSSSDTYVHTVGVSSSANLVDDLGNKISYTFTVDSLTSSEATITFTRNN